MQENEYKGYCLFNDVEDAALRSRNRAVVMANIVEFNTKKSKVSNRGASLVIGYLSNVPTGERKYVMTLFTQHLKERGFIYNEKNVG